MDNLPWSFYRHQWTGYSGPALGPHLQGRTVVITGANSGFGLAALQQLASFDPQQIILASRSLSASQEIVNKLQAKHPGVSFHVWEFDAERFDTIKAFAERARRELKQVDLLINNAGMNPGFHVAAIKLTIDQHERCLQVNTLSPLLFTLLLGPLLEKSEHPRIIFTTSGSHNWAVTTPINRAVETGESLLRTLDDPKSYNNGEPYGQSKLLLQMIARSLIVALPHFTIINANPGLCMTNLGRETEMRFTLATIKFVLTVLVNARSVKKGSWNLTTAAVSNSGSHEYWSEGGPSCSDNPWLGSGTGFQATRKWWDEVKREMEKISPGCTADVAV